MSDASQTALPAHMVFEPGTRVAVTGATGFVGGRLVEMLSGTGVDITCLIRGTNGGTRLHRSGARIRQIDLADADMVRDALRGVDVVFHLAYAWADTAWNFAAMHALIESALANDVRRLVHASSFVVYDIPEDGEVSERTRRNPTTGGYAHTKIVLEEQLLQAVAEKGLSASIVQPTIIYGPHSQPWSIEPANMLRFGTVVLPRGEAGICNAVYVDDVVQALVLAAVRPEAVGQRYLVSGPSTVTWNDFYETIAGAIGAAGPQYLPAEEISRSNGTWGKLRQLATKPNLVMHRALQVGKLRKLADLSMRVLPGQVRRAVQSRWMVPRTELPGHVHLPNPGHLQFLQGRATIQTTKAREDLGYAPSFGFDDGMQPTAKFLNERFLNRGTHG